MYVRLSTRYKKVARYTCTSKFTALILRVYVHNCTYHHRQVIETTRKINKQNNK